jgi:hypothetical protein
MKPLAVLICVDVDSSEFKAELLVTRNMVFFGSGRFDPGKVKGPFCLHYISETLYSVKDAVPNVYSLYATALTFGASSATCEASFSSLTRVMTPYRRSMKHRRKANLALMSFESNYTKTLDMRVFLQRFAMKSRKIQLY